MKVEDLKDYLATLESKKRAVKAYTLAGVISQRQTIHRECLAIKRKIKQLVCRGCQDGEG